MIWNKFLTAVLFAAAVLTLSCSKDVSHGAIDDNSVAKQLSNVSYGSDAAHVMDIYLPAGRSLTSTSVMVLIHGGGWTSGDKNDPLFRPFVDSIRRRLPGYAVFNINYRLSAAPLNLFPAQEEDVQRAMTFINNKRSEYGISDKFVLVGASAGAHLAMLQAYKYAVPLKPRAVVSFFGPADLIDMYNNPVGGNTLISLTLAATIGKTPAQDPAIYSSSSPITYISNSNAVPTMLLHGGLDPLVSPQQSVAVKNKLTLVGIANEYVFYANAGHGDWNSSTYTDAFNKIAAFLAKHVP